jgi:hypothetical protein
MKKFDLQDGVLALGVAALCAGVGCVYWPAALIVLGLLCFWAVWLMERTKTKQAGQ